MADLKISALTSATTPLAGTEVLPIVQSSTTVKVATNDLTVRNVRANATTGILQVTGPGTGTTRVMTTPDANFTAARTDASQSFTGTQTFVGSGGQSVRVYGGSAAHQWDIYGNGNNLRVGDNTGGGLIQFDTDLNMNGGNVIIGTSGKGIDFSATSHPAGMTSELLADYEEGTWTPVLQFGGATTGITYTTQTGTYTKIGRMVCARATITLSSNGSASGGATVTGLPFTVAVTTAASIYQDGISYVGMINLGVEGTVDRFAIQQVSAAGVNSNLDRLNFSNTAFFTLAVCYQV